MSLEAAMLGASQPRNEKYLPILQLFEKQKEITRSDVEEAP